MDEIIKFACYRIPGYTSLTSEALLTAILTPSGIRPMSILEFLMLVDEEEEEDLADLYKYPALLRDLNSSLMAGNRAEISFLLKIATKLADLNDSTRESLSKILSDNQIRLIDQIAIEMGFSLIPPTTIQNINRVLGR